MCCSAAGVSNARRPQPAANPKSIASADRARMRKVWPGDVIFAVDMTWNPGIWLPAASLSNLSWLTTENQHNKERCAVDLYPRAARRYAEGILFPQTQWEACFTWVRKVPIGSSRRFANS